jgi:16S rRNA (guanine527-N7)-methyltransferase
VRARVPVIETHVPNTPPIDAQALAAAGDVSRETLDRLEAYADLLRQWQRRINLVSRNTVGDIWTRHMLDSLQLARWIDPGAEVLDMGSGAGFPGLVLAIAADCAVVLAESDSRKCAFLREARRITDAPAEIHEGRVEALADRAFDVVTARALAPLPELLGYATPRLRPGGTCLFLKGARLEAELTDARAIWNMDVERHDSLADPRGAVLRIRNLRRV